MSDLTALLTTLVANPNEDSTALVLADYLQENGAEELAVRLRAAVELRRKPTLYLVSCGSYSDYSVVGVFSTREHAEKFMAASGRRDQRATDFNDVEKCELDKDIPAIDSGLLPFSVEMQRDGNQAKANRSRADLVDAGRGRWFGHLAHAFRCEVWARDEQHAIKIANEKRVALLANESVGVISPARAGA